MGTSSHKDDPKGAGVCSTFPVLLGLSPSIGKKCGASDMLDGDNVEASSKEPKRAKLTVQASQPEMTLRSTTLKP